MITTSRVMFNVDLNVLVHGKGIVTWIRGRGCAKHKKYSVWTSGWLFKIHCCVVSNETRKIWMKSVRTFALIFLPSSRSCASKATREHLFCGFPLQFYTCICEFVFWPNKKYDHESRAIASTTVCRKILGSSIASIIVTMREVCRPFNQDQMAKYRHQKDRHMAGSSHDKHWLNHTMPLDALPVEQVWAASAHANRTCWQLCAHRPPTAMSRGHSRRTTNTQLNSDSSMDFQWTLKPRTYNLNNDIPSEMKVIQICESTADGPRQPLMITAASSRPWLDMKTDGAW